nr:hypothetical protein [Tanacetum cinerariifolium]
QSKNSLTDVEEALAAYEEARAANAMRLKIKAKMAVMAIMEMVVMEMVEMEMAEIEMEKMEMVEIEMVEMRIQMRMVEVIGLLLENAHTMTS